MTITYFTKFYGTAEQAAAAAQHYAWLAAHAKPLRQPTLRVIGPTSLTVERIQGRHAAAEDLTTLAGLLGDAHGAAWVSDLHQANVETPHHFGDGASLDDYLHPREAALRQRHRQGYLPTHSALIAMLTLLRTTAEGPAAFYKDSNLRNFLITEDDTVFAVDPDDLTLAPFAYDLAKLITSLLLTYGPLPEESVGKALAAYNEAAACHDGQLGTTNRDCLDDFLALHAVLTAPYVGRHGYGRPRPSDRIKDLS
ncbi:phosphotransferase [Streptomyces phaeochromogenes]|uniref:phosphotransferase n=1 Tax=Streptomyces TaxID=1883 RepID=UPI0022535A64|nr:phosphotransferase [Streptomyces phaeochromogenes]MCX5604876.1 phosphotransferase [Streptomyces phaeochromogenes]